MIADGTVRMHAVVRGLNVVESRFTPAGQAVRVANTLVVHPLDAVALQHPELDPVGRVMVLVDRILQAALDRLEVTT